MKIIIEFLEKFKKYKKEIKKIYKIQRLKIDEEKEYKNIFKNYLRKNEIKYEIIILYNFE